MKVLFLDIDGVLTHYASPGIDDRCLSELLRAIQATGAKTVLSSDWRLALDRPDLHAAWETDWIRSLIERIPGFLGTTPDLGDRADEISRWLADRDDVESFVILDDINFGFTERFPDQFVKTAGMSGGGLTPGNADLAIRILNRPHRPSKKPVAKPTETC